MTFRWVWIGLFAGTVGCGSENGGGPGGNSGGGNDPSSGPGGHVSGSAGSGSHGPPPTCDPEAKIPPAPASVPAGEWKNVTNNLAHQASECGNLTLVSSKPSEDLLIAGVAASGLWGSRDGGASWALLGDAATPIPNRPTLIVYDPKDPDVFWESGIYGGGGGVFNTRNDGQSFTQLGTVTHNDGVSVDFSDPKRQTLLAGGHEQANTIYKSTDGGANWTPIGDAFPSGTGFSVAPMVLDSKTFLMGVNQTGTSTFGIYRSVDAGEHWSLVSDEAPNGVPLASCDGTLFWTLAGGTGMAASTDGGQTWTVPTGPGTLANGFGSVIELPDRRLAALGPTSLLMSSDQGKSWKPASPTLPQVEWPGWFTLTYSPFQRAFFISHWNCGEEVLEDAILRFDFDYEKD